MTSTTPWHAGLPTPTASPPTITPAELKAIVDDPTQELGKDYIVVDVRKPEPGEAGSFVIPQAVNLPAQTFYHSLPAITTLLRTIPKVVFHCNSCSATSRGAKTAGWYQDHLDANGEKDSTAYVLEGGVKAWKEQYPDRLTITSPST